MWLIFEIFVVLFKVFLCWIEAIFRAIVRPPKKDITGQTVLITGKINAKSRRETMYCAVTKHPVMAFVQNILTNEPLEISILRYFL